MSELRRKDMKKTALALLLAVLLLLSLAPSVLAEGASGAPAAYSGSQVQILDAAGNPVSQYAPQDGSDVYIVNNDTVLVRYVIRYTSVASVSIRRGDVSDSSTWQSIVDMQTTKTVTGEPGHYYTWYEMSLPLSDCGTTIPVFFEQYNYPLDYTQYYLAIPAADKITNHITKAVPFDYYGSTLEFLDENKMSSAQFAPQADSFFYKLLNYQRIAMNNSDHVVIHYVPQDTSYSGLFFGDLFDFNNSLSVSANADGSFDIVRPLSDCGKAFPVVPVMKSNNTDSISYNYTYTAGPQQYLAIPSADLIPELPQAESFAYGGDSVQFTYSNGRQKDWFLPTAGTSIYVVNNETVRIHYVCTPPSSTISGFRWGDIRDFSSNVDVRSISEGGSLYSFSYNFELPVAVCGTAIPVAFNTWSSSDYYQYYLTIPAENKLEHVTRATPLPYSGSDVQFVDAQGDAIEDFAPLADTEAFLVPAGGSFSAPRAYSYDTYWVEEDTVVIFYYPKDPGDYFSLHWGDIRDDGLTGDVGLNSLGYFDIRLPLDDCGKAIPVAPLKRVSYSYLNPASAQYYLATPSAQYYLAIPSADQIPVRLPDVAFYSSQTPSMDTLLESWDYDGSSDTIYFIAQNGVEFKGVQDANGSGAYSVDPISATCYEITLTDPSRGQVYLRYDTTYGSYDYKSLPVYDRSPKLGFRQLYMNYGAWTNAYSYLNTSTSGVVQRGGTGFASLQFVYVKDGVETPLKAEDLVFEQGFLGDPLFNYNGSPPDETFLNVKFGEFKDYTVSYPAENISMTIRVCLPNFGFYSEPEAREEYYLFNSTWDYTGNNNTVYLVALNGYTISNAQERLQYYMDGVGNGAVVQKVNDNCWSITVTDPVYTSLALEYSYTTPWGSGSDWPVMNLNDLRPKLGFRWVTQDNNGLWNVTDNRGTMTGEYQDSLGLGPMSIQFVYMENGVTTSIQPEALRFDQAGLSFEHIVNADGSATDGSYIWLYANDFGSFQVSYPEKNVSMTFLVTLPNFSLYSSPTPSEETYLLDWDYSGMNDTVYFVAKEGAALSSLREYSEFYGNGIGNGAIIERINDKCYKISLTDPEYSFLAIWFEGTLNYGADSDSGYHIYRINDLRPSLGYCWPVWDQDTQQNLPHDPGSVSASMLQKYGITANPNYSQLLEFFWKDSDGTLTRLHASDLTVTGSGFTLSDRGDLVLIEFTGFGEGTIRYQDSSIPVQVVLPAQGFFSAPERTEENYVSGRDRYVWYSGEPRTLYYLSATPGDLVIQSAQSSSGDISATVDPDGKYILVEPSQSFSGYAEARIDYTGTSTLFGSVSGQMDVYFRVPPLQVREMWGTSDTYSYTSKCFEMNPVPGTEILIRPWISNGGQDYVYTGILTSLDPSLVTVELADAAEHIWKVTFLGSGNTWITGQEGSATYCIEISNSMSGGNAPGEAMLFELAIPPHSGYVSDGSGILWNKFEMSVGNGRTFQFLVKDQPVTSGFRYDATALTLEALDADNGIFRITGKRPGEFSISVNGSECNVNVFPAFHNLQEVPAKAPDCTNPGNIAYFADPEGNAYVLPDYPYAADEVMTRAKLAQFIATAFGWQENGVQNPYSDVSADMPEYNAILTLTRYGVMNGYGNDSFGPNDPVTRAQAATLFARSLNIQDQKWNVTMPADVDANTWYCDAVRACLFYGLMAADDSGLFNPDDAVVFGDFNLFALLDWTGNRQIAAADTVIPALGHDLVHHEAQAPTCTAVGWNAYDTCSRCDYTTYAELAALGHDLVHHEAQAPSCTTVGWNAYDTCSRCDYTTYAELAALGHELVHHEAQAPSCTAIGWDAYDTCSRCDYTTYTELAALGHELVHHEAQAPSCTAIGWDAYDTCSRCDYTTYTELAALGHDLVHHAAQAPTCTAVGWDAYDI